jgi:hypothetical protein
MPTFNEDVQRLREEIEKMRVVLHDELKKTWPGRLLTWLFIKCGGEKKE